MFFSSSTMSIVGATGGDGGPREGRASGMDEGSSYHAPRGGERGPNPPPNARVQRRPGALDALLPEKLEVVLRLNQRRALPLTLHDGLERLARVLPLVHLQIRLAEQKQRFGDERRRRLAYALDAPIVLNRVLDTRDGGAVVLLEEIEARDRQLVAHQELGDLADQILDVGRLFGARIILEIRFELLVGVENGLLIALFGGRREKRLRN